MVFVAETNDLLEDGLEFGRQELVRLIHDDRASLAEIRNFLGSQVEDTTWCGHNNVDAIVKAHDIVLQGCSSGGDHALNSHVLSDLFDDR